MGLVRISEYLNQHSPQKGPSKCRYCSGFLNPAEAEVCNHPWNTVLYESDNFVVVPTLGSLVEGWLLIVSRTHRLCIGALPDCYRVELEKLVDFTTRVLTRAYSAPTVFEHGPSNEGTSMGCGVDHTHLHLVPLEFSLLAAARRSVELQGALWMPCTADFLMLQRLHQCQKPYLYIREPGSDPFYCTPDRVPRQMLRRIIARELGMETMYDYNKHPFATGVSNTIRHAKHAFLACADYRNALNCEELWT